MNTTQQVLSELANHFNREISFFLMTNNSGQFAVGVDRGLEGKGVFSEWFNSEEELCLTVAKAMLEDTKERIAQQEKIAKLSYPKP